MTHKASILLIFLLLFTTFNSVAEGSKASLIGWVGLWNKEMVEWVENENRIYKLCPKSMAQDTYKECRKTNLSEKTWLIEVFSSPDKKSEKVGEILITVKPGDSFVSSFKNLKGVIIQFEPDLYDQDWGYGPFFHQTILERKNNWIKIPIKASGSPVWINPGDGIQYLDIITINEGTVYTMDSESIVITNIGDKSISYRIENESDMWCDIGSPPKPPESTSKTIKINELYDIHKHLKLDVKYKRGC